jgi:hypothetical protein
MQSNHAHSPTPGVSWAYLLTTLYLTPVRVQSPGLEPRSTILKILHWCKFRHYITLTYLANVNTNHHEVKGACLLRHRSDIPGSVCRLVLRWAQHRAWLNPAHVPWLSFGSSPKDIRIRTGHYHSAVPITMHGKAMAQPQIFGVPREAAFGNPLLFHLRRAQCDYYLNHSCGHASYVPRDLSFESRNACVT